MNSETTTTATTSANCQWCGMIHGAKCQLVKAIEYEGGMVKRVEFFAPGDYGPKLPEWPNGIPPGTWGPAFAYSPPVRWTDTAGWQRVDSGAAFVPGN